LGMQKWPANDALTPAGMSFQSADLFLRKKFSR
jgi:hypothetical protein